MINKLQFLVRNKGRDKLLKVEHSGPIKRYPPRRLWIWRRGGAGRGGESFPRSGQRLDRVTKRVCGLGGQLPTEWAVFSLSGIPSKTCIMLSRKTSAEIKKR